GHGGKAPRCRGKRPGSDRSHAKIQHAAFGRVGLELPAWIAELAPRGEAGLACRHGPCHSLVRTALAAHLRGRPYPTRRPPPAAAHCVDLSITRAISHLGC